MRNRSSIFFIMLSVILVFTSLFSLGLFYLSARTLFGTLSGYATSLGEANLTVESDATVTFTTSQINWGSGRVNLGSSSAGLNTFETNNVTNGNWTLQNAGGLRIQNNGNTNLTLNLSGTKTAAQMISGTGPSYKWNVSNAESGSCRNSTGGTDGLPLNLFYNVNTTSTLFCTFFHYENSQDSLRIDFNLTIPSDSLTGALGDTITATAFPAPY
ncbi:MAG: hypothetical protein AABW89_05000 [Nanoarchaeota archaeon]|mgnify:FL=1